MLYWLLYSLRDEVSSLNIFGYITFRSTYAAITALVISFVLGPLIIRFIKKKQIQEIIRTDGPASHKSKSGTPTMGGIIILISIILPTLIWSRLDNPYILITLFATIWMGAIGFLDDYLKVIKKEKKGLIGRYKMAGQIVLGLIVGYYIKNFIFLDSATATITTIPFFKNITFDYGFIFIPVVIFVITATSNAVNLTDGLDGLAIGLSAIAFVAFAVMAYLTGHVNFSNYLNIIYLEGSGELTIFCSAAIGASLGFLWFNANPAKIFMGDVGSLALGTALGVVALLIKKELLLAVVGAVFVGETLSVIIQVASYKLRKGKRVFKMAPIHHHFELKGWKEGQIVTRFWILGILFAILSLSTFKIR